MNKDELLNILYDKEKWEVYEAFKQIENNIIVSEELYQYFDEIKNMLNNDKSYIRIRGFRIICKLSKWDINNQINDNIDQILDVLNDDKPTNVRQCLSSLNDLIKYKKELTTTIKDRVKKINYLKFKDTMSPLIKKDIDYLLGL